MLAQAFIELGVKDRYTAGFARARQSTVAAVNDLSLKANRTGLALAAMSGGAVLSGLGALTFGLYKGIQGAADLGETVSKVGVVFGDQAGKMMTDVDQLATKFGAPKKPVLDAAAAFALMGQAAGQSKKESAALASELTQLAVDAESFFDVPLPEMLAKLRSGLSGEIEPLRSLGVLLTEDATKAEAARMGIAKFGKELTQSQKILARVSLIKKAPSMQAAVGDRERTAGSPKNRQREIAGRAENAMIGVGQAVMPLWQEIVSQTNRAAVAVGSFVASATPKIEAWATAGIGHVRSLVLGFQDLMATVQAFASSTTIQQWGRDAGAVFEWLQGVIGGPLVATIETLGSAFRNFDGVIAMTRVNATEAFANILAVVDTIPENFSRITAYVGENWQTLLRDMVVSALTAFQNILENAFNFGKALVEAIKGNGFKFDPKPLLDGFEAATKEMPKLVRPAFVDMAKERAEIMDGMVGVEAKHQLDVGKRAAEMAKGQAAPAAAKKDEAKPEETPVKPEKRTSEFIGLAEFAKKLQTGLFGKDSSGKDIAKWTEASAKELQQIRVDMKGRGPDPGFAV
jgi:hypothetical protein